MSDFDEASKNILSSMDSFIEKINNLRSIMLGVSLSGLILAPFAIITSVYLITHPKFLDVIEHQDEFGFMLIVLLVGIIFVSGIWMVTGVRQYRSLDSWKKRYNRYLSKKENLDESITKKFHLDDQQQT